jgi:hypothetical protein
MRKIISVEVQTLKVFSAIHRRDKHDSPASCYRGLFFKVNKIIHPKAVFVFDQQDFCFL